MKKLFLFPVLFLILPQTSTAQQLKVESGMAFSTLKDINFDHKTHSWYAAISICLLEKKWFDIYGGAGLLTKGGEGEIPHTTETGETIRKERFNLKSCYLTPNVTLNLKYSHKRLTLYAGTGPRIDIRLNTRYAGIPDNSPPLTTGKVTRTLYGANCACGGHYSIGRFRLGVGFIHFLCFNSMYTGLDGQKKRDRTSALTLSAGFRFR